MKRIIITLTCIVALGFANAQERLFFTPPSCTSVTTDIQGNLYVTSGVSLHKFTADGDKRWNYSNPSYGDLSQVDAGIASKILLFYRESSNILLLNSELAPIGNPLNLLDKSMMTVSLAAMGNPDRIVLYDDANQELTITDLNLNVLSRTQLTFPGEFHPTAMQVVPEHRIALLDTLRGICLFDFYGTFDRTIPIPGIMAMQLMKNQILYLKDRTLYQYTLPTETTPLDLQPLNTGMPDMKTFHIRHHFLYYIDNQNVVWKSKI